MFFRIFAFAFFTLSFLVLPKHFSSNTGHDSKIDDVETVSFVYVKESKDLQHLLPKVVIRDYSFVFKAYLLFESKNYYQSLNHIRAVNNEKSRARAPPV